MISMRSAFSMPELLNLLINKQIVYDHKTIADIH